nr:reverse transcriptase domain-containing protein [Tanacetum cinerariifolium]
MVPATTSLTGFSGETIWPLGQLRLLVIIGDADHSTRAWMNFMIVRSLSPYNGIIGRPRIREIQAVPSITHEMLKFPIVGRIVTIRSTILIPTECTLVITSSAVSKEERTRPDNFKVPLHPDFPDQEVAIGGTLSEKGRTELCSILKKNLDIFAWQPSGMTGIQLAESDEEKTTFHTGQGVYCYTKMPFGLKNLGATYQRLMDKAFDSQIGQNTKVYVDDLVVKSYIEAKMLRDIDETFRTLQKINMKLNPKKCMFGVAEGVFLGYVVTPDGIKPCLDKTAVVLQLSSPRTIKEVQSLNGKLASLNRFFSKSVEKSLPLFKTLKKCIKKSDFHWTTEAEQAFKQLKQHLSELPLLVAPKPKEDLIIYLSVTYGAISAVLMTERGATQTPIYFIIRALQGPKLNYTLMEKLVLSLVFAAKRLRRYFQAHPITVITDQPSSKSCLVLADFLTKMPEENPQAAPVAETQQEPWALFMDGSSSVDGSSTGLILTNPEGIKFTYALRFQFAASNNEAEYVALIAGLRIAAQIGVQNVHVSVDSKLVANQVLGTYVFKEENMIKYLDKVKSLVRGFTNFSISQVPRSKNKKADALSKIASTSFAHLSKQVLVEVLKDKSIKKKEVTTVVEEDRPTWMTPIVEYLKEETLPSDSKEARKLRIKARQYELMEGILYRRSFLTSWLRCVGTLQAERARHVTKMQRLSDTPPHNKNPSTASNPNHGSVAILQIGNRHSWPFPEGPGNVKFLIVAMDYFTKWIEAKAVATITGDQVKKFVWDNIVCRFGLSGEIVSVNGKQFSDNPFKDWCDKLNIIQRFASVKHPQSNGLVERANQSLGEGIKARLGEGNKNWVEELPHILWAHRTMIKSSHGDTPFFLTYGTKAVIPAKIGMPTYRTAAVDVVYNDEELRLNLDLLEERRERVAICEAKAKFKMMKYYNARVRGITFRPGDSVYRSNDASHAVAGGKLGSTWEGPYEVTEALGDGAYKLRFMDGTILQRT